MANTPLVYVAGTDGPWYKRTSLEEMERSRKINYAKYWRTYLSNHWLYPKEAEEAQFVVNYCRAFIDKKVNMLFGQGFTISAARGAEVLQPWIDALWDAVGKETFGVSLGQMGMVLGDAFPKVSWDAEKEMPTIVLPDSGGVIVDWVPGKFDVFDRAIIETPLWSSSGNMRQTILHREHITRTTIQEFYDQNEVENSTRANILGEVPVVHVKNNPVAGYYFGFSDLMDLVEMNTKLNEVLTQIGDVVAYHGSPVTVMYGAKQSQMTRGDRRFWSGLPVNSKIENLELSGDLAANVRFFEQLKGVMHEVGRVPARSLGEQQQISNTTGVALHMQYLPLVEDVRAKRLVYGPALSRLTTYALRIWGLYNEGLGALLQGLINNGIDAFSTSIRWPSVLPKDRLIELDVQQRMLDMRITSRRRAALAMDQPEDELADIDAELIADQAQQARMDSLLEASFGNPSMDYMGGGGEGMLDSSDTVAGQQKEAGEAETDKD